MPGLLLERKSVKHFSDGCKTKEFHVRLSKSWLERIWDDFWDVEVTLHGMKLLISFLSKAIFPGGWVDSRDGSQSLYLFGDLT